MANLQIKNLPEELHEELRARAARDGVTLRDLVLHVLEREVAVPVDWRDRLAELPEVPGVDAVELVAAGREERDRHLRPLAADADGPEYR